jgi:hypothetical protein
VDLLASSRARERLADNIELALMVAFAFVLIATIYVGATRFPEHLDAASPTRLAEHTTPGERG